MPAHTPAEKKKNKKRKLGAQNLTRGMSPSTLATVSGSFLGKKPPKKKKTKKPPERTRHRGRR